jgi:aldehyde dehydrogenase (NAD+)
LLDASKSKIVCGGKSDASDRYIEPTVMDFGSDIEAFSRSEIMQDEIFGPLLPCVRFRDLETVIQFIRRLNTGKPLALYCFATNAKVIKQVKNRTTSGGLVINDCLMHLANHELPFGGVGNSGMGGYHGERSFNAFTHEKAVLEKSSALDQSILFKFLLSARFPPYTPLKTALVKMFSLHWVSDAVNVPVPLFRTAVKAVVAYAALRALGVSLVFEDSPLLEQIRAFVNM